MNRILVIQSNTDEISSTLINSEKIDAEIITITNSNDAIKELESREFSLILIGYKIISLDNFEIVERFKKSVINRKTPFIVLSHLARDEEIEQSFDIGCADFFKLPINEHLLVTRVNNQIKVRTTRLELRDEIAKQNEELLNSNRELKHLLFHDSLTGLENRNALLNNIRSNKSATEIILVDIRGFSRINDIYGEDVGDTTLKHMASLLNEVTNSNWLMHRFSADQFVLLSKHSHSLEFCIQTAELINKRVESNPTKIVIDNVSLEIPLSLTIAVSKSDLQETLLEHADMALKYAKKTKQIILAYNEELNIEKQYAKDLQAIEMVKKALEEDRVIPYFQPIVKVGERRSFECLVRIKDGDKIISPFFFIDSIKQSKYYIEVTKVMIEKSFRVFENVDATFSVNLSFEDISNASLTKFIKEKIVEYDVADKLILEILESEGIDNFDIVRNFIDQMRNLGAKIAIDDFGSGYSNFSYLVELRPDYIKVDGSIIKNIDQDPNSYLIAKTISDFSKEMGMQTIAEFIHSEDVQSKAQEIGFFGYQGYHLGEPIAEISD
jgi:diguanylate cyclase (GGDEF)-like protein